MGVSPLDAMMKQIKASHPPSCPHQGWQWCLRRKCEKHGKCRVILSYVLLLPAGYAIPKLEVEPRSLRSAFLKEVIYIYVFISKSLYLWSLSFSDVFVWMYRDWTGNRHTYGIACPRMWVACVGSLHEFSIREHWWKWLFLFFCNLFPFLVFTYCAWIIWVFY